MRGAVSALRYCDNILKIYLFLRTVVAQKNAFRNRYRYLSWGQYRPYGNRAYFARCTPEGFTDSQIVPTGLEMFGAVRYSSNCRVVACIVCGLLALLARCCVSADTSSRVGPGGESESDAGVHAALQLRAELDDLKTRLGLLESRLSHCECPGAAAAADGHLEATSTSTPVPRVENLEFSAHRGDTTGEPGAAAARRLTASLATSSVSLALASDNATITFGSGGSASIVYNGAGGLNVKGSLSVSSLSLARDPISPNEAATKGYVDQTRVFVCFPFSSYGSCAAASAFDYSAYSGNLDHTPQVTIPKSGQYLVIANIAINQQSDLIWWRLIFNGNTVFQGTDVSHSVTQVAYFTAGETIYMLAEFIHVHNFHMCWLDGYPSGSSLCAVRVA